MDSFATSTSIMIQYGVPLDVLINKFCNSRFEPSGYTTNPDIPMAKSIMDYIFRFISIKFMGAKTARQRAAELEKAEAPVVVPVVDKEPTQTDNGVKASATTVTAPATDGGGVLTTQDLLNKTSSDAPPCTECGSVTVPNGSCYRCINCGATTGCS